MRVAELWPIAIFILIVLLSGCGGGGSNWEDDCRARGGEVVDTPQHDHQCLTPNPLPVQDGRQQG